MNNSLANFILAAFAIVATIATFLSGIIYVGTERRKTALAAESSHLQAESTQVQTAGVLTQEAIALVNTMRADLTAAREEITHYVTRIRHLEQQNQELLVKVSEISEQLIEMKTLNLQLQQALAVALQLRHDVKLLESDHPSVA